MATNLEFIKSASTTSASTLSVTDCFSANYDLYEIEVTKSDVTATNYVKLRLIDSGGNVISDSEYDVAVHELKDYAGFGELKYTGQTSFPYMWYSTNAKADQTNFKATILNPYSATYTFINTQVGSNRISTHGSMALKGIGVHKVAEQITGFQFLTTSGDFDNLKVNVYGVK
tara:strand:- start:695 stop:1210 length:516 start_codon:yes stop_codon:yes gene_type:complete